MDLKSKFAGSMVGSALGDAVGEMAFMYPEEQLIRARLEEGGELRYTDDTAMAIGLAESITEEGCIHQEHLGRTFSRNFRREPWRGYAGGPPTVFSMVEQRGDTFRSAAKSLFGGEGSMGNGGAMRVAPAGLFFHLSPDLYEQAAASAEVTHAHPVGVDGAAVQASAVAWATRQDPGRPVSIHEMAQHLIEISRTPEIRSKMGRVKQLVLEDIPDDVAARELGRSVAVHESMPFAVYSFLRHPESFEECLFCAILNGGDRDTLGSMAGAISGAYLGIEDIPLKWQKKLENRSRLEGLAVALLERLSH